MDADIRLMFRAIEAEAIDPRLSEAIWEASNTVAKAKAALYAIALADDITQARMLATTGIAAIREAITPA